MFFWEKFAKKVVKYIKKSSTNEAIDINNLPSGIGLDEIVSDLENTIATETPLLRGFISVLKQPYLNAIQNGLPIDLSKSMNINAIADEAIRQKVLDAIATIDKKASEVRSNILNILSSQAIEKQTQPEIEYPQETTDLSQQIDLVSLFLSKNSEWILAQANKLPPNMREEFSSFFSDSVAKRMSFSEGNIKTNPLKIFTKKSVDKESGIVSDGQDILKSISPDILPYIDEQSKLLGLGTDENSIVRILLQSPFKNDLIRWLADNIDNSIVRSWVFRGALGDFKYRLLKNKEMSLEGIAAGVGQDGMRVSDIASEEAGRGAKQMQSELTADEKTAAYIEAFKLGADEIENEVDNSVLIFNEISDIISNISDLKGEFEAESAVIEEDIKSAKRKGDKSALLSAQAELENLKASNKYSFISLLDGRKKAKTQLKDIKDLSEVFSEVFFPDIKTSFFNNLKDNDFINSLYGKAYVKEKVNNKDGAKDKRIVDGPLGEGAYSTLYIQNPVNDQQVLPIQIFKKDPNSSKIDDIDFALKDLTRTYRANFDIKKNQELTMDMMDIFDSLMSQGIELFDTELIREKLIAGLREKHTDVDFEDKKIEDLIDRFISFYPDWDATIEGNLSWISVDESGNRSREDAIIKKTDKYQILLDALLEVFPDISYPSDDGRSPGEVLRDSVSAIGGKEEVYKQIASNLFGGDKLKQSEYKKIVNKKETMDAIDNLILGDLDIRDAIRYEYMSAHSRAYTLRSDDMEQAVNRGVFKDSYMLPLMSVAKENLMRNKVGDLVSSGLQGEALASEVAKYELEISSQMKNLFKIFSFDAIRYGLPYRGYGYGKSLLYKGFGGQQDSNKIYSLYWNLISGGIPDEVENLKYAYVNELGIPDDYKLELDDGTVVTKSFLLGLPNNSDRLNIINIVKKDRAIDNIVKDDTIPDDQKELIINDIQKFGTDPKLVEKRKSDLASIVSDPNLDEASKKRRLNQFWNKIKEEDLQNLETDRNNKIKNVVKLFRTEIPMKKKLAAINELISIKKSFSEMKIEKISSIIDKFHKYSSEDAYSAFLNYKKIVEGTPCDD